MYKIYIESNSPEYTIKIGNNLAKLLSKGDVVVLSGDLGAGKTKFVEGFLHNFGLQDEISSPTFNIINEYISSDNNIYHFDVYRLEDSDEFYAIGGEEYFEKGICLIEWGELISDVLPKDYIHVTINKDSNNEDLRIFEFKVNDDSKYINVLNKIKSLLQ
ncbi:MAG: tRNA (adenosine(37)-N6)-threonylcarbamoyltransferase complex ATPase subunit type 1 TsaE [Clostridia bacterium]|nr:tRNA (adenosine(37)-N6)-threonylcarbamoyltransferase complex ATPase subunit type 1 TsaE [Clostridia bacterium]